MLFTITSLDHQTLAESKRFRIYHGFGDSQLVWQAKTYDVVSEEIVE